MSHDEDDVLGIDLDAWQAPPAPAGIADGVIAQMRREITQVSVQALPVEQTAPRPSRRWWLVGGVAAAIATASMVTFALTRSGRPANARGISAGDRATHIALGDSFADVDPNTIVSWRREGEKITAQQAGGIAAWRVDEDDNLTIETGLGSIEATNASLRVEVKMLDAKKTIALSAITAAAVASLTIVVYEGVVRVRADGGTTTVAPGTAYQIRAKGDNTIVEDQVHVGAALLDANAQLDKLRAEIEAKEAERLLLVKQINGLLPENLEKAEIARVMKGLADEIRVCGDGWTGKLTVQVKVRADGEVDEVEITPPGAKPIACVAQLVNKATFSATKRGVLFRYPIAFSEPKQNYDFSPNPFANKDPVDKKPACKPGDIEKLDTRGKEAFSGGRAAEALAAFEISYACKPSEMTAKLVVASACKAKHIGKARSYWKKLTQGSRDQVAALCGANGFFVDDLEGRGNDDLSGNPFNTASGQLKIVNQTGPAKVSIDGKDAGITPVELDLPPGKHKVTLVVGANKHTFAVEIKAGETTIMSKSIE